MAASPRDEFLALVDPAFAPMVNTLADAVDAAAPELTPRVSYRMLTYVHGRDLRNWVVAIGTTKKGVHLRFLFGKYMADPAGVLRPGSSILSSIDYGSPAEVDVAVATSYAREASAHHEEFKELDAKSKV